MHITDKDDRPVSNYNPILDTEVDLDAPYIDFTFAENETEITVPKSGLYDTLYYNGTKIIIVNEVAELEIRFYSSSIPNESYRIGQKHIKGKCTDIQKVSKAGDSTNLGFSLAFDVSDEWYGKRKSVKVDQEYVDITKTKCIAILYFDEKGRITSELVVPIDDWFSPKVYLNTAYVITDPEPYAFKVGDFVDTTVYIKEELDRGRFRVVEKSYTGRIRELKLMKREWITTDENDVNTSHVLYYYMIELDMSTLYNYHTVKLASTVVKHMELHKFPDPEV